MLTAIEFVKQADGKVGEWFAKRSKSLNDFNRNIIANGVNPDIITELSEKFGTLILPIQHYTAPGSVFHMMRGPFEDYLFNGIVGSELSADAKKARAPRKPREPSPMPAVLELELTKKIQSLENNHLVSLKGLVCAPDEKAMEVAKLFREQGKPDLADTIEKAAMAAAQEDSERVYQLHNAFLGNILEVLAGYFGQDAVKKSVERLSRE